MNTALIATILFVCLVGVTLLGRRVSRYLPEDQLSADSKDAVKLAIGSRLYKPADESFGNSLGPQIE